MKAWEKKIKEDRNNLWLITTFTEKLVCTMKDGEFFTKTSLPQLIDQHYIVNIENV